MDMNLNISEQFSTMFKSKNGDSKDINNSIKFDEFFNELDSQNEEDSDNDVELAIIQNLINFMNNIEVDKTEINNNSTIIEDFKGNSIGEIDILETIKNNDKTIKKYEGNISELINKIGSDDKLYIKNIENNFIGENQEDIREKEMSSTDENLDIYSRIDIDQDQYSDLELRSISSKLSLPYESQNGNEDVDRDINTLESILDKNEIKPIISTNTNNINIEVSNEEIGSSPITEIRKEYFMDDVIKTVKYLKANGVEEIKIKISPRELGDMTIKLIKNSDEMKILISLSKEDVFDLVNKNISEITKHLSELNIRVSEVNIDIKNDNSNFFSDNLQQEFESKQNKHQRQSNKEIDLKNDKIEEFIDLEIEENLNILI